MAMNSKEISDTIDKKRGYSYTGEAGSMDADALKKEFGLKAGGNSTPSDSNTGSKSNDLLGEGYLSDSDTKRLLGNSKLKQAFIDSGGDPDSWETSNDVDTALDYLTKSAQEEETPVIEAEPEPYTQSETLAKAKAGVTAYEEEILPYTGDIITGQKPNYQDDYLKSYKLNLAKEMEPKMPDGSTPRESKIQEEKDKVAGVDGQIN